MDLGLSQEELLGLLYRTIDANGMTGASGVHIRLMVSRGLKPTPYQSPYITIGELARRARTCQKVPTQLFHSSW